MSQRLMKGGRGAAAALAREVGMSTGQLAELIAVDKHGEPISKYSRYVARINQHWPDMAPIAADTHELQKLLDSLNIDQREFVESLLRMPREEAEMHLRLIIARQRNSG